MADRAVRHPGEVAVQGPTAVCHAALQQFDADPDVEVIVISRGSGSVEDLLPFSNETLLRAVAAARTPVVSAIGHDVDTPLLDHVADWRVDAHGRGQAGGARHAAQERQGVEQARQRARRAIATRVERAPPPRRPPFTPRDGRPDRHAQGTAGGGRGLTRRARHRTLASVHRAADQIAHLRARVRAPLRPCRRSSGGMPWCSTATATS